MHINYKPRIFLFFCVLLILQYNDCCSMCLRTSQQAKQANKSNCFKKNLETVLALDHWLCSVAWCIIKEEEENCRKITWFTQDQSNYYLTWPLQSGKTLKPGRLNIRQILSVYNETAAGLLKIFCFSFSLEICLLSPTNWTILKKNWENFFTGFLVKSSDLNRIRIHNTRWKNHVAVILAC